MKDQSGSVEKLTRIFTTEGLFDLHIEDRKVASMVGEYWNAVKDYLYTGESWRLKSFEDVTIKVGDKHYRLNTRIDLP